jgi:dTDP-4-dehydrorhamnose 3,5-epimerase
MRFRKTEIAGVLEVDLQPHGDDRGFFARAYCPDEFTAAGLMFAPRQMNLSRNNRAFTLRGMHYQDPPYAEAKLVRVTRGSVFDCVVDLRPEQPTFRRWLGRRLDAETGNALFIPEGCAHGFLTLEPETDVFYLMGRMFEPGHAKGFRFDDPAIGIVWPQGPDVISPQDLNWPLLP